MALQSFEGPLRPLFLQAAPHHTEDCRCILCVNENIFHFLD